MMKEVINKTTKGQTVMVTVGYNDSKLRKSVRLWQQETRKSVCKLCEYNLGFDAASDFFLDTLSDLSN